MKPGYKRTEVGLIPEDWDICSLGRIGQGFIGLTYDPKDVRSDGVLVLRSSNISAGALQFQDNVYVDMEISQRIVVCEHDLLICVRNGSRSLIGKCALIDHRAVGMTFGAFMTVFRSPDNRFVFYCFQSNLVKRQINEHLGATINQITNKSLTSFQIPYPKSEERSAIADALSDADAFIESLEQLLTKKRQIKKGAMQELLTGKGRLPRFSGEWEEKCIAEIADCLDNLRVPLNAAQRSKMKGNYPYCGANGVLDYIDRYCVDDAVVLIAEDGGYFDEYLTRPIAYRMSGRFWVNNHAHILKSKPGFDQDFLFYSLVNKNILSFLASGTRTKLNKSELNKITVFQPIERDEQTAIATVLSDMDAEIAALETKLSKARQIKQGMMQELLTGKIRLI